MSTRGLAAALAALAFVLFTSCESPDADAALAAADAALVAEVAPMITGRASAAGTVLADGRALVAGGDAAGNQAEIFDPVANAWTATPPLTGRWTGHTALTLLDGRALLACSETPATSPANTNWVEVYAPVTGTWSAYGSYTNQSQCGAVLLADGRVLITGGWTSNYYTPTAKTLIFDPATNTLSAGAPLLAARSSHAMVTLRDGRVLVVGGRAAGYDPAPLASVELYDPVRGVFTRAPSMIRPRDGASATVLRDGRVLVVGGLGSPAAPPSSNDAEIFDPTTGRWTPAGSMAVPRTRHSAFRLPDGRVMIMGGVPLRRSPFPYAVEVFDPSTRTFSAGDAIPGSGMVSKQTFVHLGDDRVLIAGGSPAQLTSGSRSAFLYEPQCTRTTCAEAGAQCGYISDGCSGFLLCGICGAGQLCGQNQCVTCQPRTCADAGATCGEISDGCGGTLECGACATGDAADRFGLREASPT